MAVTVDTSRWGSITTGSSVTFSLTVGSNSDRLLGLSTFGVGSVSITGVTYAGASLTNAASANGHIIWRRIAPNTGANNVVISQSTYGQVWNAALSAYDVDQTTPMGTGVSATGTSTAPSTGSITVPAGGLAFGAFRSNYTVSGTPSAGGGVTNIGAAREGGGGTSYGAGYRSTTGSIVYTIPGSAAWTALGIPINPAASGVSGSLAVTAANDTLAGTGTTTVTGSLARTNTDDTLAASGSPVIDGSLATTSADDTLAASGAVGSSITGSLNATNQSDALAASGTTTVTGSAAATNQSDTLAAAGTTTVTGALARTNADDTLAATGAAGTVTGSLNVTNADDALAAQGSSGSTVIGRGFEMGGRREAREVSIKPLLQRILEARTPVEVKLPNAKVRSKARLIESVAAKVAVAAPTGAEQRFQGLMAEWKALGPVIQPADNGPPLAAQQAFLARVAQQVARIQEQDEEEAVALLMLSL